MIAALYVQTGGCYFGLPDVDPWDEPRDARKYAGPWPVVAHPPCARWCRLSGFVEARYGYKRGDDGGTFAAALAAVRTFGGVLEHPAWSHAWGAHDLPKPDAAGGWQRDMHGGWCCHIEQRWYGHPARKATWLYAVRTDLPVLRWGPGPAPEVWVRGGGLTQRTGGKPNSKRPEGMKAMDSKETSATPLPFRDLLISIARSVRQVEAA